MRKGREKSDGTRGRKERRRDRVDLAASVADGPTL